MVDKNARQIRDNWAIEPEPQLNPLEPDEYAQDYEQSTNIEFKDHKYRLHALPTYSWVGSTWSSAPREHALGFHFLNVESRRYVRKDDGAWFHDPPPHFSWFLAEKLTAKKLKKSSSSNVCDFQSCTQIC